MRKLHPKGYVREFDGEKDWLVHRKIWADAYGAIPDGHDIHHKNGIKTDNRLENLECLPKRIHALQATGVVEKDGIQYKACKRCNVEFTVEELGTRADGRIKSYCAKCLAEDARKYREKKKGAALRQYIKGRVKTMARLYCTPS